MPKGKPERRFVNVVTEYMKVVGVNEEVGVDG